MSRKTHRRFAARRQAPGLTTDLSDFVSNLANSLFDHYRPEQHYMRGPGPKSQAKNDHAAADGDRVPALVRVKH